METIQYMTPIFTPRNNFIMLYTSTKFGSDLRGLSFLRVGLVWNYPAASHVRRKDYYDKRVHGRPFAVGDLIWLHSAVVPEGKSKKLYHPWTGPFWVLSKLCDSECCVKKLTGNKRVLVVHFNRLKLCTPGTRFGVEVPSPVEGEGPPLSQDDTTVFWCEHGTTGVRVRWRWRAWWPSATTTCWTSLSSQGPCPTWSVWNLHWTLNSERILRERGVM